MGFECLTNRFQFVLSFTSNEVSPLGVRRDDLRKGVRVWGLRQASTKSEDKLYGERGRGGRERKKS